MAYNSVGTGNISSVSKYLFKVPKLSGGYAFDDESETNAVAEMSNMYFDRGIFMTRGAFCAKGEQINCEYKSKFDEEYYGNIIFHAGTSLYRFDGEKIHKMCEKVGDKGFFLRMNAKVYFYSSDEKIFETDKDFNCEEKEPYYPLIIKSSDSYLGSYDASEPFNMLTSRVRCEYQINTSSATSTVQRFVLPYSLDTTKPFYLYSDGKKLTTSSTHYDPENKQVSFTLRVSPNLKKVEVEYTIDIEDKKNKTLKEYLSKIYGSTIAFCYGGTTKDGSRAFITGNPDYPSMYFRSELKNPLFFPDNTQETLGDGSEKVNGAEKRYEKMYFFTDRHIYSMSYSFSEENGPVFTVNSINTGVGCNMNGSVKALDNTIVFGDKTDGIYILQSTDIFDELNILPISQNLKGDTGVPFAKEGKCFSCDFDRKYYICNGKSVYMWDYGRVPFYSGAEYRTSQRKLPWFKVCESEDFSDMFALAGKLYFVKSKEKTEIFACSAENFSDTVFSGDGSPSEKNIISYFTTKKYDFGNSYVRKKLLKFSFDYENKSGKERSFDLSFFADGKLFYTANVKTDKNEGRLTVKLPSYCANRYSVKLEMNGGGICVENLAFLWQKAERVKFYD